MKTQKLIILSVFLILFSCINKDDYDFDRLSEKVEWSPNLLAPLGYADFTVWDLIDSIDNLPENMEIVIDSSDLLYYKFLQKDAFSFDVDDYISIPEQDAFQFTANIPENVSLPLEGTEFTYSSSYEDSILVNPGDDIAILDANLSSRIYFLINNQIDIIINATIIFPTVIENNEALQLNFSLKPYESKNFAVNMIQATVTFPNFPNNYLPFRIDYEVNSAGKDFELTTDNSFGFSAQIKNIEFEWIRGDLGKQMFYIPTDKFEAEATWWENLNISYVFSYPEINILATNNIGIPYSVEAEFVGYTLTGNGQYVNTGPQSILFPEYPKTMEDVKEKPLTTVFGYDVSNSDLKEMFAINSLEWVSYRGKIYTNPNGEVEKNAPNFITKDSYFRADLEVILPFIFDEFELELSDLVEIDAVEDAKHVDSAGLLIHVLNHLPLKFQVNYIYFYNQHNILIDSVKDENYFQTGIITTENTVDVLNTKAEEHFVPLSRSNILNLEQTDYLRFSIRLQVDENQVPAYLHSKDKIHFSVALQTKINL